MSESWLDNITETELREGVRRALNRLDQACVELARQGWALPLFLAPTETYEILEDGTPADIDLRFVRLYEKDTGEHFERLATGVLDRSATSRWRRLLEQAVSAYRRDDFVITIPALITVCEGLLMAGEGNRTDLLALVRRRAEGERRSSPESLDAIIWNSIHCFVAQLFQRSDFAGARPLTNSIAIGFCMGVMRRSGARRMSSACFRRSILSRR
jgi:hypothetical protein